MEAGSVPCHAHGFLDKGRGERTRHERRTDACSGCPELLLLWLFLLLLQSCAGESAGPQLEKGALPAGELGYRAVFCDTNRSTQNGRLPMRQTPGSVFGQLAGATCSVPIHSENGYLCLHGHYQILKSLQNPLNYTQWTI